MRKILFHYSVLNRGGAEKSTIRLMNLFLENGWDVTIVLNFRGGNLEQELPKKVHIKYLAANSIEKYQANKFKNIIYRLFDIMHAIVVGILLRANKYDIACVGLQGLSPFLVCKIIRSKKKMLFIRNDIEKLNAKEKIVKNIKKYKNYLDYFVCVSMTVKKSVQKCVKVIADKAVVIYNVLCKEEMIKQLENAVNPYLDSDINIVTVCRMNDAAKGLIRSLEVCEELLQQGYRFKWYFVGDGPDLPKLKDFVKGKKCETYVSFEGLINNPFPYYKYADLVAVLSYYEGLCGVVNEAKVSGAAVIATEFSGIHEQIEHGKNGWIVENNKKSIVEGMRMMLDNLSLCKQLQNTDYPREILDDQYKYDSIVELCKFQY